jgi:phosphoglycolate phosphatase
MKNNELPYQAFVFDMDGTIVDTILDMKDAVNYALAKFHYPLRTREQYVSYIGNGSVKLVQRALGEGNQDHFQEVFDCYYQYYHEHYLDKTKPYPYLKETLQKVKDMGIKLFVYTNKPEKIAEEVASACFGEGFFDCLIGIPLGGVIKPDPKAFIEKTKPFGFSYDREAYFGDSGTDLETAFNIGIPNRYSVTWGYKTREFLSSYKIPPTALLDDPREILLVAEGKR